MRNKMTRRLEGLLTGSSWSAASLRNVNASGRRFKDIKEESVIYDKRS